MKLLILTALVAAATAGTLPHIKSIELPAPAQPEIESEYVHQPEPITLGMIMVPQQVLDAVAALQQVDAVQVVDNNEAIPSEGLNLEDFMVRFVDAPLEASADNVAVDTVPIVKFPVYSPILAGELHILRVMPKVLDSEKIAEAPMEQVEDVQGFVVEPVKVVDAPIEQVQNMEEAAVEPVKVVDSPIEQIQILQEFEAEPVKVVDSPIEEIQELQEFAVEPVKVVDAPIEERQELQVVDAVEPVKVVDAPIETVQEVLKNFVEPIKIIDVPSPEVGVRYPPKIYPDPTWR